MTFWPQKITIQDIALNSLWAMIAGFIGSILILIIVFTTSSIISIPGTFEQASLWGSTNSMFPFVLSFVTFIATMVTLVLSSIFLNMTSPERYKKNITSYGQLAFFGILTYLCMTPIYIYMGLSDYENIMVVFIIHCMMLTFGASLILEILNNYRYILIGFYGSFIGLFFTSVLTLMLFSSMESGYVKLLSMLIMLPLINTTLVFFKWLFELTYFHYNRITNLDGLGDIFYQIQQEEKEKLREEEEKNNI
jgi:hypothetical protein